MRRTSLFVAVAMLLLLAALLPSCRRNHPPNPPAAPFDPASARVDTTGRGTPERAGDAPDSALASFIAAKAPGWVQVWARRVTGFSPALLRKASEGSWARDWRAPDENESLSVRHARVSLRRRMGYLSFSPDSLFYVDRNAYAEIEISGRDTEVFYEPDQLVLLVESGTERTTRVHFHGTASGTDEVLWPGDSTFVLLNHAEDNSVPGPPPEVPEVEVFDMSANRTATYRLPSSLVLKRR